MTPRFKALLVVMAIAALVLPRLLYPVIAIDMLCFGLFAISVDLLFGFVGLLSFGQALFWGSSGYIAVILVQRFHTGSVLAIAVATGCSLAIGALAGTVCVRRAGIYFAMITLAIAQIAYFLAIQLTGWTGGENGLQIDTRGTFFGISLENDTAFYFVTLAIVAICVFLVLRILHSPFGTVLQAIRQNETRAIALGYRVNRFKHAVFVISATLAGLAGALYSIGNHLAGLEMLDWHTSGAAVMMAILGGTGTILGPILGAALYESLEYFVSKTPFTTETDLIIGLIFALCVLSFRRGIAGELLARSWRKLST
ncbi:MAG: branched-chain amino acid ABC transporter permease [Vulcanimicrobiaceae bacterium]